MGMDLVPRKKGAPAVHYNWSGWAALRTFLEEGEVDTSEMDGCNDGRPIRADTCRQIATEIETRFVEYNAIYGSKEAGGYGDAPAAGHAKAFRESQGMRQW